MPLERGTRLSKEYSTPLNTPATQDRRERRTSGPPGTAHVSNRVLNRPGLPCVHALQTQVSGAAGVRRTNETAPVCARKARKRGLFTQPGTPELAAETQCLLRLLRDISAS